MNFHATIQKMTEVSTAKTPVQKRDRLIGALLSGGKALVISFAKTFYALWLEVTGLLFAVFTVVGGSALFRQYRADHFHDRNRLLTVGVFTVVCAWFTVVSFVRARRTRI
jgi:predicted small integral membrane protein